MIRLTNIHKAFGKNKVLNGINLTVKKGDVVAILGPSGSGKTTLLRCVNFLERPNNARVELCYLIWRRNNYAQRLYEKGSVTYVNLI
jgi:ABC-type histidine transport system ATPase subunit